MLIDHLATTFAVDNPNDRLRGRATAMLGWTAMFLQAAPLPDVPPAAPAARTSVLPPPCPSQPADDIVVCGRRDAGETYRLPAEPVGRAENRRLRLRLPGGGEIRPDTDQGRYGDLQAKVTLKVPF
jgi:hypothetical protein